MSFHVFKAWPRSWEKHLALIMNKTGVNAVILELAVTNDPANSTRNVIEVARSLHLSEIYMLSHALRFLNRFVRSASIVFQKLACNFLIITSAYLLITRNSPEKHASMRIKL